jgi:hypothetical protein
MSQSFESKRTFRLWDYNVSHGQLLLRSPKSQEHRRNLDLIFIGVDYAALSSTLAGLSVVQSTPDERHRLSAVLGRVVEAHETYVLICGSHRHVICAAGFALNENDLDFMDSSLEQFGSKTRL